MDWASLVAELQLVREGRDGARNIQLAVHLDIDGFGIVVGSDDRAVAGENFAPPAGQRDDGDPVPSS